MKSHAFQLTTEDARAAPDVVAGTYFIIIFYTYCIYYVYIVLMYKDLSGQWYVCPHFV